MAISPKDFGYELPEELIALYPATRRRDSRLLCLNADTGKREHRQFSEFPGLLHPDDLLVFNDTRVIPARLFGHKDSGGKVEVLLERVQPDNRVLAQVRASKSPKPGSSIYFGVVPEQVEATVEGRDSEFFLLQFPAGIDLGEVLLQHGQIPLPPYIRREPEAADRDRYQTVYGKRDGAVAAPTAGLHFDDELLREIEQLGIATAYLTLHVGAGTFQPIRVDDIEQHSMHSEWVEVSQEVCDTISQCRQRGGRVIAVGTTSVRSLESAAAGGEIRPICEETDIFIYPGYQFRVVDAMVTNFHLPESTLIMLVSAFCKDKKMLLDAYREAVKENYRFFSYGDAMFLHR